MIEESGGRALAVHCDVTRAEDIQAALYQMVTTFGYLDIAFSNAGIEQAPKPAADTTEDEWDKIIAINLRGTFLCLKYQIPLMLRTAAVPSSTPPPAPGSRASAIAAAVLWLCSGAASFLLGHALVVDGGQTT
jgi:NAD(P)-dependent dehydrogenase (short-subunit alcohol dehydrogenase family)